MLIKYLEDRHKEEKNEPCSMLKVARTQNELQLQQQITQ